MRNLLRTRGVRIFIDYIMCVGDVEHLLHLFFDCKFAQDCWYRVGLLYDMMTVESAPNWLLNGSSDDTEDNLIKISAVQWVVCFARNKLRINIYLREWLLIGV